MTVSTSGRHAAALSLTAAAQQFPRLGPTRVNTAGLDDREAALAVAIHRTVLQRWLTLEYLLNRFLRQPADGLEPAMRAVLLSGAAQLLFMQKLPGYAVVDEAVELARQMVRPKAAGLTNAVLRRVGELVGERRGEAPWSAGANRLPLDGPVEAEAVGQVVLREACLPEPEDDLLEHLSAATSHPRPLLERWMQSMTAEQVVAVCVHDVMTPATIVAVEQGFDTAGQSEQWQAHEQGGFVVWTGTHGQLVEFLAAHPHRRVQDPAAVRAVASCRQMKLETVLDFCAGRGTKTRQLAIDHPEAQVFASDPNDERRAALREVGEQFENVTVIAPAAALAQRADLLLLDVPCSNTGVLARRPEARYRMSQRTLREVTRLQWQILEQATLTVKPGGHVLYSTCSVEPEENHQQVQRWLDQPIHERGGELVYEDLLLPAGHGRRYHDGSYHALVRLP